MNHCRSCAEPIEWVRTVAGRAMPLDVGTVEAGNVIVDEEGVAHVVNSGDGDRVAHFATCAFANQHRKRARR